MSKLLNPLTDKENEDLKAFIFVTNDSHLKVVCICPECGVSFFHWLQDGHDMDLETVKMEMATTDCTVCAEDWKPLSTNQKEECLDRIRKNIKTKNNKE